jgi:hypothetical protein
MDEDVLRIRARVRLRRPVLQRQLHLRRMHPFPAHVVQQHGPSYQRLAETLVRDVNCAPQDRVCS